MRFHEYSHDLGRNVGLKKMKNIIFLTILLLIPSKAAMAVSDGLKSACSSDYAAYCSSYKATSPPSASLRACMRSHRHQLLEKCLRALGDSGYVSRREIEEFKRETSR
jgi:hypothetical protein